MDLFSVILFQYFSTINQLGDQIIDINGVRVSDCPIEKIKETIRNSPEYIVCTVKPVTHYTSHEDSPQPIRSAYTEVDPGALQAGNTYIHPLA